MPQAVREFIQKRLEDKLILRKIAVIESVNDELKNICQIEPLDTVLSLILLQT